MYLEAKRRRGDECRLNIHIYFDYRNWVSDLATAAEVEIQLRISGNKTKSLKRKKLKYLVWWDKTIGILLSNYIGNVSLFEQWVTA